MRSRCIKIEQIAGHCSVYCDYVYRRRKVVKEKEVLEGGDCSFPLSLTLFMAERVQWRLQITTGRPSKPVRNKVWDVVKSSRKDKGAINSEVCMEISALGHREARILGGGRRGLWEYRPFSTVHGLSIDKPHGGWWMLGAGRSTTVEGGVEVSASGFFNRP
jgi:hypothetical protein